MQQQRVVVALGGNAFAAPQQRLTMAGQFEFARQALAQLRPLLELEFQVLITHGNGPQVGFELIRVEAALGQAYAVPLDVCVAESEGELGYVLTQSLHEVLAQFGRSRPIASLLTQVVVDASDPAFAEPTKPIGGFYSEAQADELRRKGFQVREDAGRGYRRVVPSPRPLEIIEAPVIRQLLELGIIVIAAGGGGIPVVRCGETLRGIEAVVDKDLTAALLAHHLTGRQDYLDWHRQIHDWAYAHFPDPRHGEWFGYLHRDGRISNTLKGNLWKSFFHHPRALWYCWRLVDSALGAPANT